MFWFWLDESLHKTIDRLLGRRPLLWRSTKPAAMLCNLPWALNQQPKQQRCMNGSKPAMRRRHTICLPSRITLSGAMPNCAS